MSKFVGSVLVVALVILGLVPAKARAGSLDRSALHREWKAHPGFLEYNRYRIAKSAGTGAFHPRSR
jgi:hypothetical protein